MTSSWPACLIEAGALLLLVFTPLACGAVEPWSEAIAELVVLGMAITYVLGMLRDWELRVELPPGWLPGALFLALIVLQSLVPSWSLDPHATRREALKLLAVAAFFLICYNTYRMRAQAQRAVWTMIIMATVISIFGIVQRTTWNGHLYWVGPEAPGSAFGPFVNRTHFAGLVIVVVPMALAFMLASKRGPRRSRRARSWRDRLREWNSTEGDASRLIPFLIVVMGGAALVSGSRGGMVALIVALLAMTSGALAHGRSWNGRAAKLALATVLVILAGIWIGGEILHGAVERLAEEVGHPRESGRLSLWGDALKLWRDAPVLGTGLATFGVAFPRFRTLRAPFIFSHAESDWVGLFTDTGIVGLGLALAVATVLGWELQRRRAEASGEWARTLGLAGVVALLGTAIQGIGNFNLPVISNLVFLGLVLAVALGANRRAWIASPSAG